MSDPTPMRYGSNAGQSISRRDGVAKVTGAAAYAADNHPQGLLHAVYLSAGIARGTVTGFDLAAAQGHPGVVRVYTPDNRPALAKDPMTKIGLFDFYVEVLQDNSVRYAGQPIALVVADTLEAAQEGARLLAPRYTEEPARIGMNGTAFALPSGAFGAPSPVTVGDVEAGLQAAAEVTQIQIDTPAQYHNAMEPHAIVADWQGDRLTVDTPNQALVMARDAFATWFDVPPENVTLRSPYLGGGFGSKAILAGPQVLAVMAARDLDRPVKLALRRDQMFGPVGHRGATRQQVRIGADDQGRLTALAHDTTAVTSSFDCFIEPASNASLNLYAAPALATGFVGLRADIGTPGPMRAPGEASGSAALEVAIDAAAQAAGMDPLAFRLANYAETDPQAGRPFSSKALRDCYEQGAERFGWSRRPPAPGQMRDDAGRLVGWGMGTAMFACPMFPATARATLYADGTAVVETAGADMGQGAWTALAQLAAEGLGLDMAQVTFHSGRSDQPDAGVAGGSGHTASAGGALHRAGQDVVAELAELAMADPDSPLFGAGNAGVTARNGRLVRNDDDSRSDSYADILTRAGRASLSAEASGGRDPAAAEGYAMYSHGAVFAEVKVDPDLFQVRVTRLVGAFAAGRIVNPKLATSQLQGGMIWGLGFALLEEAVQDPRSGKIVNADLAGYHVPAHADVPPLDVILVDEQDTHVNALGIKGVGEIGITGTVGAIANAVHHATGIRTGRYPIKIADLLAGA